MDIVMLSLGMPFNGETIYISSLGGSETAAYYQARELARRGHRMTLFTGTDKDEVSDGVRYCSVGNLTQQTPLGERFEYYAKNTPIDVLIIQRHQMAFQTRFQAKVCIWQTHDLALHRHLGQVHHGLWQIDATTCVSEWHRQQTLKVYGIDPDFVKVVPNGVDLGLYEEPADWKYIAAKLPRDFPWDEKFMMLYQARPERGMEHLVRPGGIMARLLKEAPSAHLIIAGYDNTQPGMRDAYEAWFRMAKQLPNVTLVGACTKPGLARLQKACDLMIYPTEFDEVSCISAMEAMAAGLPFLSSECGALPETCADARDSKLIPLKDGKADEDQFVEWVQAHINTRIMDGIGSRLQREAAEGKTWEKAVDALEGVIDEAFEKRRGTYSARARHMIEHGDIMLAERDLLKNDVRDLRIAQRAKDEIYELYAFAESKTKYETHYRKHQSAYYDAFEDKVIGENVTGTNRFQGVAMYALREEKRANGRSLRMLDYGCAHGHYLMPLAAHYKNWRFTGVDISARAIAAAMRWSKKYDIKNVEFVIGDDSVLNTVDTLCPLVAQDPGVEITAVPEPKFEEDLFDVILAGEVLEHVPNPVQLLNRFLAVLKPGGVIIATTPVGRWEWTGHEAFKTGREHLWHFERADIEEMCRDPGLDLDLSYAGAGHDETGKALGSWVWCVRADAGAKFQDYDIDRKLKYLAPRETISGLLIVKDGERTLRKAIDAIAGWADEIVIAIDPRTADGTRDVIERFQKDNPWTPVKVIDGLAATEVGFDAARNRALEDCSGDWVLWIDADEELQRPWELWKLAKRSQNRGFGMPQVHYAFDPPQVLTTDFPCRFFRRGKIKFYGVVHEHPEEEIGVAVPHASIRSDAQLLHNGYVDERTRRARFIRNLPLLHQDLKKYPERGLNRFLLIRDIAQGLAYELEQTGGRVNDDQAARAKEGIDLFEKMVEKDPPRILVDALQYYSLCVDVVSGGFKADLSIKVSHDVAPDLAVSLTMNGRFHSREFFFNLVRKIQDESTKHYEDRYL